MQNNKIKETRKIEQTWVARLSITILMMPLLVRINLICMSPYTISAACSIISPSTLSSSSSGMRIVSNTYKYFIQTRMNEEYEIDYEETLRIYLLSFALCKYKSRIVNVFFFKIYLNYKETGGYMIISPLVLVWGFCINNNLFSS